MTVKNYINKILKFQTLCVDKGTTTVNGNTREEYIVDSDGVKDLSPEDAKEVKTVLLEIINAICNNVTVSKEYNVANFRCLHYNVTANTSLEIAKITDSGELHGFITLSTQNAQVCYYFDASSLRDILTINDKEEMDKILAHFILSNFLASDEIASIKK